MDGPVLAEQVIYIYFLWTLNSANICCYTLDTRCCFFSCYITLIKLHYVCSQSHIFYCTSSPASNILIKITCQCSEVLYCSCQHKFIVQLGDFDSSATVPGYQLHLEEHQMIRYASVLPLGTMGYRAPEVSSHLLNILHVIVTLIPICRFQCTWYYLVHMKYCILLEWTYGHLVVYY